MFRRKKIFLKIKISFKKNKEINVLVYPYEKDEC